MPNKYDEVVKRMVLSSTPRRDKPLTEAQLVELESRRGYPLPSDYREFLRDYGGIQVQATFQLKDSDGKEGSVWIFHGMSNLMAFTEGEPGIFEVEWAPTLRQILKLDESVTEVDDPPRELLPIGINPGGSQTYLALSGRYRGAVFFWENWGEIYFAADSFDEFMHSLQRYE